MANIFSAAWHHKKISAIAIIIILTAGYFYFNSANKKVSATIYTYGTVQRGMISQSVAGTGQVSASEEENIKSKVSGDVIEVSVTQGQQIKAGDVLVRLDSSDAQAAHDVAKANLENAQKSLQKSQQDNSLSLSQAQDAVKTANDSFNTSEANLSKTYEQAFNTVVSTFADLPTVMSGLNDIINGSNSAVVQSSGTYLSYYLDTLNSYGSSTSGLLDLGSTYTTAKNSYNSVLDEYKSASRYSSSDTIEKLVSDSYDACKKISNATKALIDLIRQYQDTVTKNGGTTQSFSTTHLNNLNTYINTVNGDLVSLFSTQQSITSAILSVDSAKTSIEQKEQSLETLQDLTNPMAFQSAQLAVTQKETTLSDATQTLSYYTIVAPFDGIVTSVDVKAGDSVAVNAAIATIITNQEIATISLNEIDVSGVSVGQKATLTFDAVSDLTLTGHVSEIDAVGTVSSGVVSYNVTIVFDTQDDRVKPGMSITAAIITNTKQDVLLVPNSAVKSNAAGNYILVPAQPVNGLTTGSSANGQTTNQQAVVVGLSDNDNTEIVSGLNEGDMVVIKTATQTTTVQSTQSNGSNLFRFLGGGGPPGEIRTTNTQTSGSTNSNSSRTSRTSRTSETSGSSESSNSPAGASMQP